MKSLCFGAVLWDLIEGEEHLGGAPFNLAVHLKRLGFTSSMVSSIGTDARGDRIVEEISGHGIDGRWVRRDPDHPTACVTVTTNTQGESDYVIHEDVASDHIELSDDELEAIVDENFDVICHGTLEARGHQTHGSLFLLLNAVSEKEGTRIFCDLNLRQSFYSLPLIHDTLVYCDILKLNDSEASVVAELLFPDKTFANDRDLGSILCHTYDLELAVITRGERGCVVVTRNEYVESPGLPVDVVDTVGPGDAFSAAFLREVLSGGKLEVAAERANKLGAFVASRRGALPEYDAEILQALKL